MTSIESRLKGDKGRSRVTGFEASAIIHMGDDDGQNWGDSRSHDEK